MRIDLPDWARSVWARSLWARWLGAALAAGALGCGPTVLEHRQPAIDREVAQTRAPTPMPQPTPLPVGVEVDDPWFPRPGFEVFFDQSLEQIYHPWDTGFTGFSEWARALRAQGAVLSTSTDPLDELLRVQAGPGQVLVLGVAARRTYPTPVLSAIRRFVERGGGVLVFVEHDDLHGNGRFQNGLLRSFGIEALESSVRGAWGEDMNPIDVGWPALTAPTLGLEELRFYASAPLVLSEGAEPLVSLDRPVRPERSIVGAQAVRDAGRVVALGDLELAWNMAGPGPGRLGFHEGENGRLLVALCRMLAGLPPQGEPVPPSAAQLPEVAADAPRVHFASEGDALLPDGAHNGLAGLARAFSDRGYAVSWGPTENPADLALLVLARPLTAIEHPQRLLAAPRLLLIGDGREQMLTEDPELGVQFAELMELELSDQPDPLNDLAVPLGFAFTNHTALGARGSNHLRTWADVADGARWRIRRAGAIELAGEGLEPLAQLTEGGWASGLLTVRVDHPPTLDGYPHGRPIDLPPQDPPLVAVVGERVFALADVELVGLPQVESTPELTALPQILGWLDGPATAPLQ